MMEQQNDGLITAGTTLGIPFMVWLGFYFVLLTRKKVTTTSEYEGIRIEDTKYIETSGRKILAGILALFPAGIVFIGCVYLFYVLA